MTALLDAPLAAVSLVATPATMATTYPGDHATGAVRAAMSALITNTALGAQTATSFSRRSVPSALTAAKSVTIPRPASIAPAATTKIPSRNAAPAPTSVRSAQDLITVLPAPSFIRSTLARLTA